MLMAPPLFRNGPVTAEFRSGQVEDTHERDLPIAEDQTAGGTTLSVATFLSGFVAAAGNAGAVATTLPTADQICAALRGSFGIDTPPVNSPYDSAHNSAPDKEFPSNAGIINPGASFRFVLRNANAGNNTLTGAAGVSIVGTAIAATNTWKEYLVRIKNASPTQVASVSTTNTTKVLSNVSPDIINKLTVGMLATGTGLGAAPNRIMAINRDNKTVTLDVASTATADNIAVTFTPEITVTYLRTGTV